MMTGVWNHDQSDFRMDYDLMSALLPVVGRATLSNKPAESITGRPKYIDVHIRNRKSAAGFCRLAAQKDYATFNVSHTSAKARTHIIELQR